MATSPRQLFGTLGAQRLWQLNLQSVEWKRDTAKLFIFLWHNYTFSCYQPIDIKPYHFINTSHVPRECALARLHAACQWKGQDEDARSTFLTGKKAFPRVAGWSSTAAAKVVLNSSRGVMRRHKCLAAKPKLLFQWKKQNGLQCISCSWRDWLHIKYWWLKIETGEP